MGVSQINRVGFPSVNITDEGDNYVVICEGIDLFLISVISGQAVTLSDVFSDVNIPSLPESEFEKDNIVIDLSAAYFSPAQINEVFYMVNTLVTGDYQGREINMGNNDLPDSSSGNYNGEEAMNSLLMKNFSIIQ